MRLSHSVFIPKFISILAYLNHNNNTIISDIIFKNKITFAHVHRIVKELNEFGIVNKIKNGRKCYITLTEKGIYISKICYELENELKKLK